MIKYILIVILLISSALGADKSQIYLKLGTGANRIVPVKIQNDQYNGKIKLDNAFPLLSVGIGSQLTEDLRAELVFDYYFMFNSNEVSTNTDNEVYKVNYKTKINTIMLNTYKDIVQFGRFTPFIGGGIGINSLKDKATGNVHFQEYNIALEPASSKRVHKFVYKLTVGIDIKLYNNINAELSYNYFNLGKNRPRVIDGVDSIVRRNYRVHNITASIRLSL